MPGNLASLKTVTAKTVKGNDMEKVDMLYYSTLRAVSHYFGFIWNCPINGLF